MASSSASVASVRSSVRYTFRTFSLPVQAAANASSGSPAARARVDPFPAPGVDSFGSHEQELADVVERSEEHTSELQSLMRISYAVFCLKYNYSFLFFFFFFFF